MPTPIQTANSMRTNTRCKQRPGMRINQLLSAAILTAVFALSATDTHAAQVTFAQFQQNTAGSPFVFTNLAGSSTFTATNVPINFQYLVANSYGPVNQNIPAHMSISAAVDTTAVTAGIFIDQPLTNIQITITADTPVNANDLLLMVSLDSNLLSTGHLSGMAGGNIAFESGDTGPLIANNFQYFSSFVAFDPSALRNYAMSFSSVSSGPGNFSVHQNGYLNSFSASGTGTFAATMVPEPATGGLALAGAGLAARKFRRRSRTTETGSS